MRNKKLLTFLAIALFLAPMLSMAQGATDDTAVTNLMSVARANITKARMSDGNFVPAENAEDLKKPVIPFATGRRVVKVAATASTAAWCGVEWKESYFKPFMKGEAAKGVWTEKQLAYISLLHGVTMAVISKGSQQLGKCSEADAAKVKKQIDAKDFK